MSQIARIHSRLAPLKKSLIEHPIYQKIDSLEALWLFMEHHVFPVWDFMSLLKVLQRELTSVDVPWMPVENSLGCRLINEIVLGEESDEDGNDRFASHFDLYHRAMKKSGASTKCIDWFLAELPQCNTVSQTLTHVQAPAAVQKFVNQTFEIIDAGNLCAVAAFFTFGREELLPNLFQRIVDELNVEASGGLDEFKYYLVRHIDLDGETHGPMAEKLIESLCGEDEERWAVTENAAVLSLQARLDLWDGLDEQLQKRHEEKTLQNLAT